MNTFQRIVILLWISGVLALTVRPPWTVHETWHYSGGHEESLYAKKTEFRWFFASPQWEVVWPEGNEPSIQRFSGSVRFDLLTLELFMASVVMAGLLLVTARGKKY